MSWTEMGGREITVRSIYALFGVALIGLGAAVLLVGGVGVDPFTALNTGIAEKVGMTLGTTQLIANSILFVAVLIFGRHQIGIGTAINMVLTGYFIGWFAILLRPILPDDPSMAGQALLFIVGLIIFDFGASAYMCAGVGTAPYDAIAPIIVERSNLPYRLVRTVQDVLCVVGAFLVGGQLGIGTITTAFFNGPLIEHYSEKYNKAIVARLVGRHAGDAASTAAPSTDAASTDAASTDAPSTARSSDAPAADDETGASGPDPHTRRA